MVPTPEIGIERAQSYRCREIFSGTTQEWFSKKKDRTDVGVGWLVRPPRKKKSLPFFS